MNFYITGLLIIIIVYVENKSSGINLQCPHKKKIGDYCGKHSNENKWRLRIDEPILILI